MTRKVSERARGIRVVEKGRRDYLTYPQRSGGSIDPECRRPPARNALFYSLPSFPPTPWATSSLALQPPRVYHPCRPCRAFASFSSLALSLSIPFSSSSVLLPSCFLCCLFFFLFIPSYLNHYYDLSIFVLASIFYDSFCV